MAQPGISAKIEELQFRIKTDPKSRLFFPLAEELRKHGMLPEAEQVLRTGLGVHATYLSAWVSLGRVLREQGKNAEAVEALTTALQVDPGNVVAARLVADAYLDLGDKVEAIKKYKLVQALMPSDEELGAKIDQLDRDLHPIAPIPVALAREEPESPFAVAEPEPQVEAEPEPVFAPPVDVPLPPLTVSPFDETEPVTHTIETPFEAPFEAPFETNDEVPMSVHHTESPFEEPSGYTEAALTIEEPAGMHVEEPPPAADAATPWLEEPGESEPAADVFAPAEPEAAAPGDDLTATTTMADLYVRQGLIDDARRIYEHMLQRDPFDEEVRSKLNALGDGLPGDQAAALPDEQVAEPLPAESTAVTWQPGSPETSEQPIDMASEATPHPGNPETLHRDAKVIVLEQWLAKVSRREPRGA